MGWGEDAEPGRQPKPAPLGRRAAESRWGLLLSRAGAGACRRQGALRVARGRSAAAARGGSEPGAPCNPPCRQLRLPCTLQTGRIAPGLPSALALVPLWSTRLSPLCGHSRQGGCPRHVPPSVPHWVFLMSSGWSQRIHAGAVQPSA